MMLWSSSSDARKAELVSMVQQHSYVLLSKRLSPQSSDFDIPDSCLSHALDERWQAIAEPCKGPDVAHHFGSRPWHASFFRITRPPPAPLNEVFKSDHEWLSYEESEFANIATDSAEDVPFVEQHAERESNV